MKKTIFDLCFIALLSLGCTQPAFSQIWKKVYDLDTYDYLNTVLQTQDGGFLLFADKLLKTDANGDTLWTQEIFASISAYSGNRRAVELADGSFVFAMPGSSSYQIGIWKYEADGTLIWHKTHTATNWGIEASKLSLQAALDGGFILSYGVFDPSCDCQKIRLLKTDADGNEVWLKNLGQNNWDTREGAVVALTGGGYALGGSRLTASGESEVYIARTNDLGILLWQQTFDIPGLDTVTAMIETSDNFLIVAGYTSQPFDYPVRGFYSKIDLGGNIVWTKADPSFTAIPRDIVETPDGNYAIVGGWIPTNYLYGNSNPFFIKADPDGNALISNIYLLDPQILSERFISIVNTNDGYFAIGGYQEKSNGVDLTLTKIDGTSLISTHFLKGKLFHDEVGDCDYNMDENPIAGWMLTAEGAQNYYGATNSNGDYLIPVAVGTYLLSVATPPYWETCEPFYLADLVTNDTVELNLPASVAVECPYMEVDMYLGWMRPCSTSQTYISYCNQGTLMANGATVEVTLPIELAYESASVPLIAQNGQTFVFDIGDVGINECGNFTITSSVVCDQDLTGQTLCGEAHIYPDSICVTDFWNGPYISVSSLCQNDSILFTLTNVGENMALPQDYIVIEDNAILMSGDFQLGNGGQLARNIPAQNGTTYHLVANQAEGFPPLLGYHIATTSIEGCVGPVNTGAFNQLPPDDGEPWLDVDCQIVTNSYDPNDKSASPSGWTEEHLIDERTELDYLIRFQNTGTDTAFRVVLIDTLSSFLDPATIRPGASSHPFTFELSGQGVAKFIFDDIMLPDSNVNEPASNGFVKFKIDQKSGNLPGTVIENTAGIYFDFNDPIYTNTTFHTIRDTWVSFLPNDDGNTMPKILVSPNPMDNWTIIELLDPSSKEGELTLVDAIGRVVLKRQFVQGKLFLARSELAQGLYFFRVDNQGKSLAKGKVVVQ